MSDFPGFVVLSWGQDLVFTLEIIFMEIHLSCKIKNEEIWFLLGVCVYLSILKQII